MKDMIEEQRERLLEYFGCKAQPANTDPVDARRVINEAFLKIAAESDFIIARLRGEAGMIEVAARKMPHTTKLLMTMATLMRGYAARLEDSQAPAFNKKIITLNGVDG